MFPENLSWIRSVIEDMTKQDFLFDKNFCNANKFKLFMRFAIYVQIFHTLHPFIERSEVMLGQGGFES